jgi:ring-1,2-phenylacetyl-CoA epoxidase subunit PaaD
VVNRAASVTEVGAGRAASGEWRPAVEARSPVDEASVRRALAEIPDPELPVVSIVDLGMVRSVDVSGGRIRVELLPTFVACPALELIRAAVAERLERLAPDLAVEVEASLAEPWTSDRITERGREQLAAAGIAPPRPLAPAAGPGEGPRALPVVRLDLPVPCPSCGSTRTRLENLFGPTLCRTIRWCADCRQPFEHLKTV